MRRSLMFCLILILTTIPSLAWAANSTLMTQDCWGCHRLPNLETRLGVATANQLCWDCHDGKAFKTLKSEKIELTVRPKTFRSTSHGELPCIFCHDQIARTPHKIAHTRPCQVCHRSSAASMVVSEHTGLTCSACHLENIEGVIRTKGNIDIIRDPARPALSHSYLSKVDCRRCHQPDNRIGAPPTEIDRKGIFCLGCHPSHVTVTKPLWALIALLVFVIGVIANLSFWLKGTIPGSNQGLAAKAGFLISGLFQAFISRRLPDLIKGLWLDGIWHRRLFRASLGRWVGHMMLFGAIAVRFLLSLYILWAANFYPLVDPGQPLLNINTNWVTFIFDATGLIVIIGVFWAWLRRWRRQQTLKQSFGPDWTLLLLVGIAMLGGFVVEAFQIAMAGSDWGQRYAFVGNSLAGLISPETASRAFYAGWTFHVLWIYIILAYLPFSKAWHLLISPLVAMLNYREEE